MTVRGDLRTMNGRWILSAVALLALTSCAGLSRSVTRTEATFVAVRDYQLVVQMDLGGAFTSQRLLPLAPAVKVTVDGKAAGLDNLREGRRIRISRDDETREVVAIDAL